MTKLWVVRGQWHHPDTNQILYDYHLFGTHKAAKVACEDRVLDQQGNAEISPIKARALGVANIPLWRPIVIKVKQL